jgi:hypothetical protein
MQPVPIVWLDVAGMKPDVSAVDELARLALCLRRCGYQLKLREPSEELLDLIELTGLSDALGADRLS